MVTKKVTGLNTQTGAAVASDDLFYVLDKSDAAQGANGSLKTLTPAELRNVLATAFVQTLLDDTTAAAFLATLGAPAWADVPGVALMGSGLYYEPWVTALTTNTVANGNCTFVPIVVGAAGTVDLLGCEVTSGGGSGALVRLGLWRGDGHGKPGALVVDGGTVAATGTGAMETASGLGVAVTPGRYWLGAVTQGAPSPVPTYRLVTTGHFGVPSTAAPVGGATSVMVGWQATGVTGAFGNAPTVTPIPTPIRCYLKAL